MAPQQYPGASGRRRGYGNDRSTARPPSVGTSSWGGSTMRSSDIRPIASPGSPSLIPSRLPRASPGFQTRRPVEGNPRTSLSSQATISSTLNSAAPIDLGSMNFRWYGVSSRQAARPKVGPRHDSTSPEANQTVPSDVTATARRLMYVASN